MLLIVFMCFTLLVPAWFASPCQVSRILLYSSFNACAPALTRLPFSSLHLSPSLLSPPPFSSLLLSLAVFSGRWLMSFWTGSAKIHELYTAACGLYMCWLSIRAITVLLAWMPQGRRVILLKVQEWTLMVKHSHMTCSHCVEL